MKGFHRAAYGALAALLLGSAVRGVSRALSARGNDLTIYLDAAAEVARGQSPYLVEDYLYLPFFAALLAPLEHLPRIAAVTSWQLGSAAAAIWAVAAAARLADPRRRRPWLAWLTLLLTLRLWVSNLSYGQANAFTFAAAIAVLTLHVQRKERFAGALAGLATAFKLLPGVLLVLLALRGRWRSVAWGVSAALCASLILPASWVGPTRAIAQHQEWFERVARPYIEGGDALLEARSYLPGQSLVASAYRALAATPVTASDPVPRAALAQWEPEVVHALVRVAVAAHLALLGTALYRGRRLRRARDVALAGALSLCTALIVGPLVHKAHMAWSALGFAVLIERTVAASGRARLWTAVPLALAVVGISLSAPLLVGRGLARGVLAHNGVFLAVECLWLGLLTELLRAGGRRVSRH